MKKINLFLMSIVAMFVAVVSVNADTNGMPAESPTGTITLTSDVTLTGTYNVASGKTLTIDLNGHKITGPANAYAIVNEGTLTIKDSGTTKGSIDCTGNSNNSCIVNKSSATIDGVTVKSAFVALKNESNGTLEVKNNSYITSSVDNKQLEGGNTSTLFNYGTVTVSDSKIEATGTQGVAVMGLKTGDTNSKITMSNAEIVSVYAGIDAIDGASVEVSNTVFDVNNSALLTNNGGTISVSDSEFKNGSIVVKQSGITLNGEIKTKYLTSISYAQDGARVTLTENATITDDSITVPEGVTLVIPDDVEVSVTTKKVGRSTNHGTLTVKGKVEGNIDAVAYNEDTGVYYGSLERAVENATSGSTIDVLKDTEETYSYSSFDESWHLVGNSTTAVENLADNVTINLNGHTVKSNLTNPAGKSLTIEDETGDGKLEGTISNSGNLTIENGNFTNIPTTENGCSTTLNGGTYPNDQIANATIPEDKELVENEDGTYSILYKGADFSKLDEAVKKALELLKNKDKYTTESVEALEAALEADNDALRALRLDGQEDIDAVTAAINAAIEGLETKTEKDAPETLDAALAYVGLALLGLGAGIVTVRKLRNN